MKTAIRELRVRLSLTQAELASKVGVRRETIVFLEKGRYNPSLLLAHKIALALNTTIDQLFIFDEDIEKEIQRSKEKPDHRREYIT